MAYDSGSLQTLTQIRQLLDERGLRPKHRLGQNFLHDKNQLVKLMDAAEVGSGDVILEVGPGTGTLTSALLERGAEVIACEIDEDMAGIVEAEFASELVGCVGGGTNPPQGRGGSLRLIRGDAMGKHRHLNAEVLQAIDGRSFKLVANLPYQIASGLITTLLVEHGPENTGETPVPSNKSLMGNCVGQFVTIQKEVADRLMAKPNTKEYGALSIIVQALGDVQMIGVLSATCFWPPPEVTSAMVGIRPTLGTVSPHAGPLPGGEGVGQGLRSGPFPGREGDGLNTSENRREFARFVVELFTKRRKQLGTILGRDRFDWPAGVTADLRPEALEAGQVVELWRQVSGK